MKILAVGGGSGGHVTPLVAVLEELRKQQPDAEFSVWSDANFYEQAKKKVHGFDSNIPIHKVSSGKFRRYNHLTWSQQVFEPRLFIPNMIDLIKVLFGIVQSLFMLIVDRPSAVFAKGGYVCLPVGIAAKILRIPLVIHDSDAHPGLTNRILSRWANYITTGAPLEYYSYPKGRAAYVGIPIGKQFEPVGKKQQDHLKEKLGFRQDAPLVFITGGGLGAKRMNDATAICLSEFNGNNISVALSSGVTQYDELKAKLPANSDLFELHSFSDNMHEYLGAADLVVARAGATTMLELAAMAKPTVLVPNRRLTGGHQIKNAQVYVDSGAAEILDDELLETDPKSMSRLVQELLADKKRLQKLSENIKQFAKPDAAKDVAEIILRYV